MIKNIKNNERRPKGKVRGRLGKKLGPDAFRALMRVVGMADRSAGKIVRTGHFRRHKAIKRSRLLTKYKKLERTIDGRPIGPIEW